MPFGSADAIINTGLKIALFCASPLLLISQGAVAPVSIGTASSLSYSGCPAPADTGINFCTPYPNSTIHAPLHVVASSTSEGGQVETMELWADGKKITEAEGSQLDLPVNLDSGIHELTVVALDATGASVKSSPVRVKVKY